jgi:hypothetical protein
MHAGQFWLDRSARPSRFHTNASKNHEDVVDSAALAWLSATDGTMHHQNL